MARVLLVVLVFAALLYGCDRASSPVERQEKHEGVEQAARGEPGPDEERTDNGTISATVDDSVEAPSYNLHLLDYFVTDHYFYLENSSIDDAAEGYSHAGKFVVVNYSVTNTSLHTVRPDPGATLHTESGSKTEVYEESGDVMHPRSGPGTLELAPGEMSTGQFIFDVPSNVTPESVTVLFESEPEQDGREAGLVDLTRQDALGPSAEEILALQYEYLNMTAWKRAYELFAEESKREVSLERYEAYMDSGYSERPTAVVDYAFPSVRVEGNHATIDRVFTLSTPDGENRHEAIQEAVLEDEGWRIVMRDDQVRALLQRGTTVQERTG